MSHPTQAPIEGRGDNYHGAFQGSIIGGQGNKNVLNIHYHQAAPGFKQLCEHVAESALHDSGEVSEQPKCHPGTRIAILDELKSWATALEYAFPVKWLHGPAGSGKSAIQRTIAQILQNKGLLASFFFFRSDPTRNSSARFTATIAYQLALTIPKTRIHIEQIIERDPFVFSKSIWKQVQALVVAPILLVQQESPFELGSYPRIIVVDGLDECSDFDKQSEILQALCRTIQVLPIPVAVLVASRPEHQIRDVFDLGDLNRLSSRISLDRSYDVDADIKKYLIESFNVIREHHPMKSSLSGSQWPSLDIINVLVAKASGQFIYVSTVEKFVNSPRHNPARRLDIILGARDAGNLKPFEQLDVLYSKVFSTIVEENMHNTLRILGALLVPYENEVGSNIRSPSHLERLFKLETGDVQRLLYDLQSLLDVGRSDTDVRILHASLPDFLFDRSRSDRFWINAEAVYADLTEHYIHHLPEWQDGFILFMENNELFFSKAAMTSGLHSAIESCDLGKLASSAGVTSPAGNPYPFGLNFLVPALLDSAVNKLQFTDGVASFSAHVSAYQHLLEAVIPVYFQSRRLKSFLVLISSPCGWVAVKHYRILTLSEGEVLTDCTSGFNLSETLKDPPILPYIRIAINDPGGSCFLNENEYADIILYTLNTVHPYLREPNDDLTLSVPQIFSYLLPKSSVRNDLILCMEKVLRDSPLLESRELCDAIETYLSRTSIQMPESNDMPLVSQNESNTSWIKSMKNFFGLGRNQNHGG